jgi:DNA-binding transcriptional MerR regulator/methylmalonyl-CoA mutase cobalamin-binding subunit
LATSELRTYRIGAAARLTGLSEHLIRVWERRYGAVEPVRTETGIRLYSDADVARLQLLKRATERGHAIGTVAGLGAKELERLVAAPAGVPIAPALDEQAADRFVSAFLAAVDALDMHAAEEVVAQADAALGSRTTALRVLIPILREVGRRWESGKLTVAQEHAATAVLRNYLGTAVRALGRNEGAQLAVSTTPPGELHELGALIAAVYVASLSHRVVYLGPNLPSADLARAVRKLRADLVLVSAVAANRKLRASLEEMRNALPGRVRIVVGGAAAEQLDEVPKGVDRLSRIEDLSGYLA